MENKIHILSTRELQPDLVQAVQKAGLQADIIPFINIQYRHDEATRKAVHACVKEEAMVVFTSRHGVAAVTNILNTTPLSWHIAALGGATREQAASSIPVAAPLAPHAMPLVINHFSCIVSNELFN